MKLYGYWRSTSSFRVRIALALKGLDVEQKFVHLVRDGGENNLPAYRAINPQGRLPVLALADGTVIIQSPAILEYLEEGFPEPPLLPTDMTERARVRAVAAIIACDIHPLHNIGPLNHLRRVFGRAEPDISAWVATWIGQGLSAVEALIGEDGWCFGAQPSMADVYLVPQIYAARRFAVPVDCYTRILRVERLAAGHKAFQTAHPAVQLDAQT